VACLVPPWQRHTKANACWSILKERRDGQTLAMKGGCLSLSLYNPIRVSRFPIHVTHHLALCYRLEAGDLAHTYRGECGQSP
jgi:hypothetical protein